MKKCLFIMGAGLFSLSLFKASTIITPAHNLPETQLNESTITIINLDNNETLAPSDTPSNPEENLSSIDIRDEISQRERDLVLDNTIERLNADVVHDEERAEIAKNLQKLDQLRTKELEVEIRTLLQDVAQLEISHPHRLEQFGVKKS